MAAETDRVLERETPTECLSRPGRLPASQSTTQAWVESLRRISALSLNPIGIMGVRSRLLRLRQVSG